MRQTVVTGDYATGSFELLPLSEDRASAALFFARLAGSSSFGKSLKEARWYMRASLVEFRSVFDLLLADLRSLGLADEWKGSSHQAELEADELASVLRKVRDFAIHSARIKGIPKNFTVTSGAIPPGPTSEMPAIVIEQLDRAALRRGGKDELKDISDEALSQFNQQASQWPADMLIHIAVFRASETLAAFLVAKRK